MFTLRKLLKTKDRRQLEIIEYLLEESGWKTNAELALLFDCTPRVPVLLEKMPV